MKPLKPMSPLEELYWEIAGFEKKLKLLKDKIAVRIPSRTTAKPKGYVIDPRNGKRVYYDKRKKQEYDKRKKASA